MDKIITNKHLTLPYLTLPAWWVNT